VDTNWEVTYINVIPTLLADRISNSNTYIFFQTQFSTNEEHHLTIYRYIFTNIYKSINQVCNLHYLFISFIYLFIHFSLFIYLCQQVI
jgi:hypothetical protein